MALHGGENKSKVLGFIVILGLMISGCSILSKKNQGKSDNSSPSLASQKEKLSEKEKAFDTKKAQFTKLPEKVQLTEEPYLKGKLVYLTQAGTYWSFQNNLGNGDTRGGIYQEKIKDLIAQSSDEVTTVVLKPECQSVRKGDYKIEGKTVPSFIEKCELTIIDTTIPAVIYRKKLEGKLDKEETVLDANEVVGRVYDEAIYTYLASLPRK